MFKVIENKSGKPSVSITVDGRVYDVHEGQSVATALLQLGLTNFRSTPVRGNARSAFCMMGVCFDCLVVIDGLSDQQACMMSVQEGMQVKRQQGATELLSLLDVEETT